MGTTLAVAAHPLLDVGAFVTRFAQPLAQLPPVTVEESPPAISDDERAAVRALLRQGGFKPSGRSKPASEYLQAAHSEARFPRINAAVDACNFASLHWGLPISLIDLDRVVGDLRIAICPPQTSYVFNPSGQLIDASGLLAVFDSEGPTGTPVKDAQRTKTHDGTTTTLAVIWGTNALSGRTADATRWYRDLVATIPGATNEDVTLQRA
jgi:DNA/RNA-binding domain of Phe-tRNA-synthetase-like protein